jgi:hypothetical protein
MTSCRPLVPDHPHAAERAIGSPADEDHSLGHATADEEQVAALIVDPRLHPQLPRLVEHADAFSVQRRAPEILVDHAVAERLCD